METETPTYPNHGDSASALEQGQQGAATNDDNDNDDDDDSPPTKTNHLDAQTTNETVPLDAATTSSPPPSPSDLDPPLSSGEKMRDALLRLLDGTFFQYLGLAVLFGVVASGALFFFFLMGWQTLCRPRTDCQPRNDIYNIAIHFLNVFFTYMATVSMPWRCVNFLHTTGWACPFRNNEPGHDLYGQVTDDVWFHVPLRQRLVILIILLLNCLTQYANQATRIIFYNYDLQNEFPGNMWVNIFFGLSMICAVIGGCLMGHYTGKIRATDPERFGLGPIELAQDMWKQWRQKKSASETNDDNDAAAASPTENVGSERPHHSRRASEAALPEFDPTRAPQRHSVIDVNRSSMRMFAM